jgi:hypothetical protein
MHTFTDTQIDNLTHTVAGKISHMGKPLDVEALCDINDVLSEYLSERGLDIVKDFTATNPALNFNGYGIRLKAVTTDELIEGEHFVARVTHRVESNDFLVEIAACFNNKWVPYAFRNFMFETEAQGWVDTINANVNMSAIINGLFQTR